MKNKRKGEEEMKRRIPTIRSLSKNGGNEEIKGIERRKLETLLSHV